MFQRTKGFVDWSSFRD
uniref:Uncharacterized protein n=1 Tax=Anguilla anguilla TaxID=7936 RepID=A0A0E9T9S2_ANGAN